MSYDARIVEDFPLNTLRLLVVQRRGDGRIDYMMGDGTWQTIEDGTVPVDAPGLVLPREAVQAVARAVADHLGDNLPSTAEVKVLREWLAVEVGRVDKFHVAAWVRASDEPTAGAVDG